MKQKPKSTPKPKSKPRKKRAKKYDSKVTLHPLTFEQAMDLAVNEKGK